MTRRTVPSVLVPGVLAGPACALALAGCGSAPVADRTVYETRDAPVVVVEREVMIPARAEGPPRGAAVRDTLTEAERRRWIEERYYAQPAPERTERRVVVRERYVPAQDSGRDRVVVVDRSPRWYDYVPPVTIGLGWWHGHHRGHGWGWGLGWGWPYWR